MNLNQYLKTVTQEQLVNLINKDKKGESITQGRISQMTREGVPGNRWVQFVRVSKGKMTLEKLAKERQKLSRNG